MLSFNDNMNQVPFCFMKGSITWEGILKQRLSELETDLVHQILT